MINEHLPAAAVPGSHEGSVEAPPRCVFLLPCCCYSQVLVQVLLLLSMMCLLTPPAPRLCQLYVGCKRVFTKASDHSKVGTAENRV
jgi:hypothetical protein